MGVAADIPNQLIRLSVRLLNSPALGVKIEPKPAEGRGVEVRVRVAGVLVPRVRGEGGKMKRVCEADGVGAAFPAPFGAGDRGTTEEIAARAFLTGKGTRDEIR